jgi:hypothetical protein
MINMEGAKFSCKATFPPASVSMVNDSDDISFVESKSTGVSCFKGPNGSYMSSIVGNGMLQTQL